jgi:hypothetical protein
MHTTLEPSKLTNQGKRTMSWTIETALSGAAVEKSRATQSGYSFWLKGLPTEIQVVLSVNGERGGFNFHTSHVIKTPKQAGPYHTSRPWGDDAAYALHQAVTSITQHYEEAIKAGLPPDAKWLLPNR